MPRRRRSNLIQPLLLLLGFAVFLLMGVLPVVEMNLPIDSSLALRLEWLRSRVMESVVAVWFFAFGSMVGSFINVVVWRMPRGVSVVSRGSACPYCCAKIRLQDNIPIFGWIKLKGRCRVCRLPISARYPIVESIFGCVFLLMFFVELQSACINLPGGARARTTGIIPVILYTRWDVVAIYAWHMFLLVMLLVWALMAWDRSVIPVKTIVFAMAVGLAGASAIDYLYPVKWYGSGDPWFESLPWLQSVSTGIAGLVVGFLAGELLESRHGDASPGRKKQLGISVCTMAIGLFAGWQFLAITLLVAGTAAASSRLFELSDRFPLNGWLAGSTLIVLCFWRIIDSGIRTLPIPEWSAATLLAAAGLALFMLAPVQSARVNT